MPQPILLLAQLLGGRSTETLMSRQVDDSIGIRMNSKEKPCVLFGLGVMYSLHLSRVGVCIEKQFNTLFL